MKEICKIEKCMGCLACVNACPKQCISIGEDKDGFIQPLVDDSVCIGCNKCVKVCPANGQLQLKDPVKVLAGQICNEKLAMKSTSGGLFQALAKKILRAGGIVCAARQFDDCDLHHVIVKNERELESCLKSKYYQSNVGHTYSEIKTYLREGTKVLFCGTPCQVAGLMSFLGKAYDNLITCDLICHGVPSKKVVRRYISDKEKQYGAKMTEILFRDKSLGWDKMRVTVSFENGKKYSRIASYDTFYFGFFRGLYYRKCCYECPFAQEKRIADLSLGDFWGIEYTESNMKPEKGISLVLVNTPKGMDFIGTVNEIVTEGHTMAEAIRLNHNLKNPSYMHPKQDYFYSLMDHHSLEYALFRVLPVKYLKFLVKKCLGR